MGVIKAEQPLCSCYKECQEFHKVIELKDTGVVVYCHTIRREDQAIEGEVVGSTVSTCQDVFIIHNTNDVKITPADVLPAIEKKDISCPRCRHLFERAQELLQKVPLIDKKNVMGICDRCRLKAQLQKKPCSECDETVKKFLLAKSEQSEDTKRLIKIWLSRMKHLLKDAIPCDKPRYHRSRASSDLQIDRLCQYSPRSTRQPVVKQLFQSDIHKSDTSLHTEKLNEQHKLEKSVIFTEPVEPMETPDRGERIQMMRTVPSHTGSNIKDRPKILKDTQEKPELEKSGTTKIYDIPKIAPWEQEVPSERESAMDVNIATIKRVTSLENEPKDIRAISQKPEKEEKVVKREDRYLTDDEVKFQRSVSKFTHEMEKTGMLEIKTSIKSKKPIQLKEPPENIVRKQFSFFFPKGKKAKKLQLGARSSQLIKNTQEKLRQRDEEDKRKHEEERQKKIEEDEKKRIAREEKKQLADERKKQAEEQKKLEEEKKRAEERKKISEEELEKMSKRGMEKKISEDEKKQEEHTDIKTKKGKEKRDLTPGSKLKGETEKELKDLRKDVKQKTEFEKETGKAKKDINAKSETKDKADGEKEKTKKERKREEPKSDKSYDVSGKSKKELKLKAETTKAIDQEAEKEKEKKELKSKIEPKKKIVQDAGKEKEKKDLKPKPETKTMVDQEADKEKEKKDLKIKTEPKKKIGPEAEKDKEKKELKSKTELKDKTDIELAKENKKLKSKTEVKDKKDSELDKENKKLKSKTEVKDKKDSELDKENKKLKSKTEVKDYKDEEKLKTDLTSKTEVKHTIDKEADKRQKEKDKQELKEQKQREREEKSQLMEQLRKEKETASSKKPDTLAESAKKNLELKKEKQESSKKSEDLSKEKKIEDLTNKKQQPLKETKDTIQDLSKEKEELSTKKQVPPKEADKIKQESIKEKEAKEKLSLKKEDKSKDKEETSASKKAQEVKLKLIEESKEDKVKSEIASKKPKEVKSKSEDHIEDTSKPKKAKEDKSKVSEESKDDIRKVQAAPKKEKAGMEEAEFKKLQAELAKQKDEDLKRKRQNDAEEQKARELAEKKIREGGDGKLIIGREAKAVLKPEPKRVSIEKQTQIKEKSMGELKVTDIKMRDKRSSDDLILKLVKMRQTAIDGKEKTRPYDIDPSLIYAHKIHQKSGLFSSSCDICQDSDLEMDVESYDNKLNLKPSVEEMIVGEKIIKHKGPILEETEEEIVPMLFKSVFQGEDSLVSPLKEILTTFPEEPAPEQNVLAVLLSKKDTKREQVEEPAGKGIIRYALSDRTFIDKGWTMLPTEKVVRKMNVYRMRPAHPEFDWFEHNKNKRLMTYDTGEKLAEFDDNGRGRWYYRNGGLALDYYDAEETNAQQRFVVYSSGEPDERGRTHPFTILATFDYLGNGIVFDHAGKIRLKYNQTEGVVLDRGIGPVSHWKWHTLNDPPVLQQVMIDTQMAHKDPAIFKLGPAADSKARPDNEEMLAIEFDNFIKEKSKKLSQKFKPFQIKMKALKINEHFSLKVLDQATIYLIYRDGSTNLKLNIGMILDHQEIVDTDTAEVGEVSNNLERFPARTDSLAGLQRSVAYAQRYERQRTERERRLRPPAPCASADQLTAAASPPLRPPLRTLPAGSTSSGICKCRKPTNNLYYNTRLL